MRDNLYCQYQVYDRQFMFGENKSCSEQGPEIEQLEFRRRNLDNIDEFRVLSKFF